MLFYHIYPKILSELLQLYIFLCGIRRKTEKQNIKTVEHHGISHTYIAVYGI